MEPPENDASNTPVAPSAARERSEAQRMALERAREKATAARKANAELKK